MKDGMKIVMTIVILILIGTYIFSITTIKDANEVAKITLEEGKEYTVYYDVNVNDKAKILDANMPQAKLIKESKVIAQGLEGDFAKIKYYDTEGNEKEGYILAWFLTDDASRIEECEPYLALVQKAREYMLPQKNKFKYQEEVVLQDKVIKVLATYEEYSMVSYVRYDSPSYDYVWIKNEDIVSYNSLKVREGYIKNGAKVYSDIKLEKEMERINEIVKITDKGDIYLVETTGGVTGYIKKNAFTPLSSPEDIN